MNKFLVCIKAIEVTAISFLCVSVGIFAIHADRTLSHIDATVTSLSGSVQQTLNVINRPCGNHQPCGTLADIAKTLNTIRGTAGQIEIAANHEDKRLALIDAQETVIFSDIHATLGNANTNLTTLNSALQGIGPIEFSLTNEVDSLTTATTSLNTLVSDPSIPPLLANLKQSSENINATSSDIKTAVHKWLHPTWLQKIINGVQTFGVDVGRIFL